jgi:hypothetical protein
VAAVTGGDITVTVTMSRTAWRSYSSFLTVVSISRKVVTTLCVTVTMTVTPFFSAITVATNDHNHHSHCMITS